VQEIVERQKRGEDIDLEDYVDERNLGRNKAQVKSIVARASRLVQRKMLRQTTGARGRHKGFVPPYNTQSRVFDINELRNAATQVRLRVFIRSGGWPRERSGQAARRSGQAVL
jgi:hypothetical protein